MMYTLFKINKKKFNESILMSKIACHKSKYFENVYPAVD